MKRIVFNALAPFFVSIILAPSQINAQQLQTYCSWTQSDDCIQVDSHGYWWDKELGLPARKTSTKLSIKVVGKTRIVKLHETYYCTKSSIQVHESYLACGPNGWLFKLN